LKAAEQQLLNTQGKLKMVPKEPYILKKEPHIALKSPIYSEKQLLDTQKKSK